MTKFIARESKQHGDWITVTMFCEPDDKGKLARGQSRYILGSICPLYIDWLKTRASLAFSGWLIEETA